MAQRLSYILLGVILTGLIISGFTVWLSEGVTTYSPSDYNESQISAFNKMEELTVKLNRTRTEISELDGNNPLDVIGNFFTSGYQTIVVYISSIDIVGSLIGEGIKNLPLGEYGSVLQTGLWLMLITLILIGVFMHFIIKSDRL